MFPVFSDTEVYPSDAVTRAGNEATFHIRDGACFMPMKEHDVRTYALFLMTAHILVLNKQTDESSSKGEPSAGGTTFKSTVGSVSVENTKPNSFSIDDYNYWLTQTEYGRRLLALLDIQAQFVFINNPMDSVRVLS